MALELPARIGKYQLEEFLGGGMSQVYRAKDTVIGRTVAIKILTDEGCSDEETKARFLQEARMAGNIGHENVISIYDFGEDENRRPYMVMEFLRGEDLRQAIRGGRTGDLHDKLRIALQVARALGYVHTQKIVHRDIKPENIHLSPSGQVKLMDFGIAKTEGLSMTRTGYVMGTPYYMAPEQVLGKHIDDGVDIYAFGVLCFELLSGTRPILGENVERIFYSILHEPLNLDPLREAGVPDPVCSLVAQCTAKDRLQRPPDFATIATWIESMMAPPAAAAPAPEPATPAEEEAVEAEPESSNLWIKIGIGVIGVLVVGVVIALLTSGRSKEARRAETPLPATLSTPTGEMLLIPAGNFPFGKDAQPVSLPAFYMDRTEVRNADYQAFCQATGHALPDGFPRSQPDYPAVNVTIDDARLYAKWAGKRLPTSQEWEKAARGTEGLPFPWGKEKDATRANVHDNAHLAKHELVKAASFENGASPYGVLQMVGNAWEFVDEPVQPSPQVVASFARTLQPPAGAQEPWYRIRGESFQEPLADEVMYDASTIPARWKNRTVGFRCVKNPPAH
jgi:serine/threonine protein kinase